MVYAEHKAEWPDKILFAGLLLVIGGLLGTLFGALKMAGSTGTIGGLVFFEELSSPWILGFSIGTVVFGALAAHYQSWVLAVVGIVASILSMGFFGFVPVLGVLAGIILIKAVLEGEELMLDAHKVESWEWPDKAIAASLFLTALGGILLVQAATTFASSYQGLFLENPTIIGLIPLFIAVAAFISARQAFHQQSNWLAWVTAALGILSFSYILVGPILSIFAMIFLGLAEKEGEFLPAEAFDEATT